MAGKYVSIDATELRRFVERLNQAGRGKEFEKELSRFLDAIAVEFLSYVQDFIIQVYISTWSQNRYAVKAEMDRGQPLL